MQNLDASGKAAFDAWRKNLKESIKHSPDGWDCITQPNVHMTDTNAAPATVTSDGIVKIESLPLMSKAKKKKSKTEEEESANQADNEEKPKKTNLSPNVEFVCEPPAGWLTAIRFELSADTTNPDWAEKSKGIADVKFTAELLDKTKTPRKLTFSASSATAQNPIYDNGRERIDVHPNWRLPASA